MSGSSQVAGWAWALLALAGCSSTPVRRQALAADAIARAFNTIARPLLVRTFEDVCRGEIERACPAAPCARAPMTAALAACERRWEPVFVAYESARAAHDVWRVTLMRCQRADAGCGIDFQRDAAAVAAAVGTYRCAVRALGRTDLDPVPGPAPACEARDGG